MNEQILKEETLEESKIRQNPFTVISKTTFGEYNVHDIQSNSSWGKNPYEDYATVPDDMVEDIQVTRGFCNIELNEDGTEVVSFTALGIPEIPEPEPQMTEEQLKIAALEEQQIATEISITDMDLQKIETEQAITDLDLRLMVLEG